MMPDGTRYVSFTFDDGLIRGARAAAALFERAGSRATFYVVTGWVRPRRVPWIRDPHNRGRDHGSWEDWRELAERGHEVGAHGFSHLNASGRLARWIPGLVSWEMTRASRDLQRHLGAMPVSCSMPWNAVSPLARRVAQRCHAAMRVGGPRSSGRNHVPRAEWYALESWAPEADLREPELWAAVDGLKGGEWLIFQFHSLDDEGYMPMPTERLAALLEHVRRAPSTEVVTIEQMVRRFGPASAGAATGAATADAGSGDPCGAY